MFIDEIVIEVDGGNGGSGAQSFRREKFVAKGGPDGGDGGRGGSVILLADRALSTLVDFKFNRRFHGTKGENGRGYGRYGKGAEDLVLKVPLGTEVYEADDEGEERPGRLLADLCVHGQTFVAARGGTGGRGNMRFAGPERRAPRYCERGEQGEARRLRLSLKLLADVGLVGLPNAGKSTLLTRLSNARPKVADYPFTTLVPHLGVVRVDDACSFVLADLPGLIEGAAEGRGRGNEFLKHVQRTTCLVYLLDASPYAEVDPVTALKTLRKELKEYEPTLLDRPYVVVANKMDLAPDPKLLAKISRLAGKGRWVRISGVTGAGLDELLTTLWELHEEGRRGRPDPVAEGSAQAILAPDAAEEDAYVERVGSTLHVRGRVFLRRARMVNFDTDDAVFFFNRLCRQFKISSLLKGLKAHSGDTVDIDGMQFEYKEDLF